MSDYPILVRVLFAVAVVGGGSLALFVWFRALRQIAKSDLDPDEKREWRRRVLVFRVIGLILWERYRRRSVVASGPRRPEDEGLNDAPPPGAD